MVLETHMKLYVTESDFLEKNFLPPKLGKWIKNGSKKVLNLLENLVINFYWICCIMKIYIFAVFRHKSHIWENFVPEFWANVFSQSDCWIFKIYCISKTNRWKKLIFCMQKFRKAKSWFNDFLVDMVKNGHGPLVHETIKSAISKEWIYELRWFFACWL